MNVLRIDSSARTDGSLSRRVLDRMVERLGPDAAVSARNLAHSLPQIDANWVAANTTPEDRRTAEQREALALSDTLIVELEAADVIVIGMPVYNFGVPTSLKAWIDLVCRVRRTFQYTQEGPVGLLRGKRAIVVYASGGTPMGSAIDFASGYLRHVLGFIGIDDVTFVDAGRHMADDGKAARAEAEAVALAADLAARAAA